MSTLAVNAITNAAGGNTAQINGMTPTADSLQGFRNRIINGGMTIDQRNNGAAVTFDGNNKYVTDRFFGFSNVGTTTSQQSTVAPTGFNNSLLVTQTAGGSVVSGSFLALQHRVEGFNMADLGWGTAAAQTITLSFWVRSSVTGAFSVALNNSAFNRSYVCNYTINAANTWEYKTVEIEGDTSGTWLTNNGIGISLVWNLGYGSNFTTSTLNAWLGSGAAGSSTATTAFATTSGATWQVTGVQLEAGAVATPFERRPFGAELALCQRYFQKSYEYSIVPGAVVAADAKSLVNAAWSHAATNAIANGNASFQVTMRAAPTAVIFDKAGNSARMSTQNVNGNYTDNVSLNQTIASESNIIVQKYAQSCAGIAYAYTVSAEL